MPLPTPRAKETEDDFMGRCMGDDVMRSEYPDQSQRAAVCHGQWAKKGKAMNEHRDFGSIPAGACILAVGEFELGDNGPNAKTAPVRLTARTGKPIDHWFWGKVVHDLAGMHLSKSRIPIDYVHDPKEVVGFLNHFDTASGDLVTSGALVPFKDSDRATEILHKMRGGVPYEASINFGGDGIKVQEIADHEIAQVNGYDFEGPGVIVREWPLRGVAICPYGADANTEASVLAGNNARTYTAAVVSAPGKETAMKAEKQPVEIAAQAATPAAVETETTQEDKQAAVPVEAAQPKPPEAVVPPAAVEAAQVEAQPKPEASPAAEVPPLSRDEFTRIADEFGDAIAVQAVRENGDYNRAVRLALDAALAEVKRLRGCVAELETQRKGGQAVPVTDAKPKPRLFNTGK